MKKKNNTHLVGSNSADNPQQVDQDVQGHLPIRGWAEDLGPFVAFLLRPRLVLLLRVVVLLIALLLNRRSRPATQACLWADQGSHLLELGQ